MAVVTMPTTPNFTTSTFRLSRAIAVSVSPFSGKTRTQEFDRVGWEAEVGLPPMNRSQAAEWQAFIVRCKGSVNTFRFADPDARVNQGTYTTNSLKLDNTRINDTSETLTFDDNDGVYKIVSATAILGDLEVGDFVHVTGALDDTNNGTFKVTSAMTTTQILVDGPLVDEVTTAGCKIQSNVKGSEGLNLIGNTNDATGTIKKGDYLHINNSTSPTKDPIQLLMVTEDATQIAGSPSKFAVRTTPKLRTTPTNNTVAVFDTYGPEGMFRMTSPMSEWSADHKSLYSVGFSCIEVI